MPIHYHIQNTEPLSIDQSQVTQWIKNAITDHQYQTGEINIIFTNDADLLQINQKYLNHNYYTDIITFDYTEDKVIAGDLYISIDRVKENAKTYNISYHQELYRIIIHGILHLLGYQDKTSEKKQQMTQKENEYLKLII